MEPLDNTFNIFTSHIMLLIFLCWDIYHYLLRSVLAFSCKIWNCTNIFLIVTTTILFVCLPLLNEHDQLMQLLLFYYCDKSVRRFTSN